MKQGSLRVGYFFCLFLFFSVTSAIGFIRGRSFLAARSQSTHAERELVGWQDEINLCADGQSYGSFSLMPIYSNTLYPCQIAEYFFGSSCLKFSGSRVSDRGDQDILADYFGLPTDYVSTVFFRPSVQNFIGDINLYIGLDMWYPGLYFRAHAPIVNTSSTMQISERTQRPGTAPYPAGYMAHNEIPREDMAVDVMQWMSGAKSVGDIEALEFGKIAGCQTLTGLSEIEMAFGLNFVNSEFYHFGFNARTAIPTGNHSNARFLFEPIIGNGGHWELGLGLTGHTHLWESCNELHAFSMYGDANLTYLFASHQRRSFDFRRNGPSSRYILIEEMGTPLVAGMQVGNVPIDVQYHGRLMPAINQTTLDAKIGIPLQIDAVFKIAYNYKCYSWDVGYNLWARMAESLECRQLFPSNRYAIKGDASVYGFTQGGFSKTPPRLEYVAVNATQQNATMHAGQDVPNATTDFANKNADSHAPALLELTDNGEDTQEFTLKNFDNTADMNGSQEPELLTDESIDNLSGLAHAALSNTFFTHLSYAWEESCVVTPYLGVGAELTLDASSRIRRSALSEWGAWVKGGVSY